MKHLYSSYFVWHTPPFLSILILLVVLTFTAVSHAGQLTVTSLADSYIGETGCADGCSLREAIETALPCDEIFFSPLFDAPQEIVISSSIRINRNLVIRGKGANLLTIRTIEPPGSGSRLFHVDVNITAHLVGMTLTGGRVNGGHAGGAILNEGTLTLSYSHVTDNVASSGGGGVHGGKLTIISSTISNNVSAGNAPTSGGIVANDLTMLNSTISSNLGASNSQSGGGILTGGPALIVNSTIVRNETGGTPNAAGGIRSTSTTNNVVVRNSIVALNVARGADVAGNFGLTGGGYNLIGDPGTTAGFGQSGDQTGISGNPLNPLLGPLAMNEGTTPTHAFSSASSPAVDAGDPADIFSTDQRGFARPFDGNGDSTLRSDIGALEFGAAPVPTPTPNPTSTPTPTPMPSPTSTPTPTPTPTPVKTNGKLLFGSTRDGNWEIYIMESDGTNQVRLTNNSALDGGAEFSPDGTRIVFNSNRNGNYDLYVMNIDGTNQVRLTNSPHDEHTPTFAPDGSKILYVRGTGNNQEIFVTSTDGSNAQQITNNSFYDDNPTWSPDGLRIAFTSRRNHPQPEIYTMNLNGTDVIRLTNNAFVDSEPAFSPDGTKLLFFSNRAGNYDIWVMDVTGSNPVNLSNSSSADIVGAWSPDGSKIVFSTIRDGNEEIYMMNANGTGQTRLTLNSVVDEYPAWQPFWH